MSKDTRLLKALWRLLCAVISLCLFFAAFISAKVDGDYARGAFDLVLAFLVCPELWLEEPATRVE